jgi:GrpB-like predicted nucleotidyltransferase (UPF0157 family)
MNRTVIVSLYDDSWRLTFEKESELIKNRLGSNCIAIHHVGSTSIPGLASKPVIDMLCEVYDIQAVDLKNSIMGEIAYKAYGELGMPFRRFFTKTTTKRFAHVHVFEQGSPEIKRHLLFRDYVKSHPKVLDEYALLKQHLAKKFPNDIQAYCQGKDAFIRAIDEKSGYDGMRMVCALSDYEWQRFCQLKKIPLEKSNNTADMTNLYPLVFYHISNIIGLAEVVIDAEIGEIRSFILEKSYTHQKNHDYFVNLISTWLTHRGCKELKLS